ATIGKVVDMGMTDPFNMGGAMAPAAVDTIIAHFKERNIEPSYYDLIVTGDLGEIGKQVSFDLLRENGIDVKKEQYQDCGTSIYRKEQAVNYGASGTASSAVGIYGHYLKMIEKGKQTRTWAVPTGPLHPPLVVNEKEKLPVIAQQLHIN